MEGVSRALCGKNTADGLLILLRKARREEFLLYEFRPELGGFRM